jgi:hypothetical protein
MCEISISDMASNNETLEDNKNSIINVYSVITIF